MSIASFVSSFSNTVQPASAQLQADSATQASFGDVIFGSVEDPIPTRVPDFLFKDDVGSEDEFALWQALDDRSGHVVIPSDVATNGDGNLPSGDDVQPEARLLAVSSAEGREVQLRSPRKRRQTTNNRPVNIFGLGFGTNQRPGQDQQQTNQNFQRSPSSVSNEDVTFDEDKFNELLESNMKGVLDSAMNQLQTSPEEIAKGVEKFGVKGNDEAGATTTEAPATTYEPTKTIISRYPDLIFHPDITDLLMLIIGILFSSIFFPGLIGFLACFVRLDQLPLVLLPRPTLNGRSIVDWLGSLWG